MISLPMLKYLNILNRFDFFLIFLSMLLKFISLQLRLDYLAIRSQFAQFPKETSLFIKL